MLSRSSAVSMSGLLKPFSATVRGELGGLDHSFMIFFNIATNAGEAVLAALKADLPDATDWIIIANALVSVFNSCFSPTRMNGRGGIFSVPSSLIAAT